MSNQSLRSTFAHWLPSTLSPQFPVSDGILYARCAENGELTNIGQQAAARLRLGDRKRALIDLLQDRDPYDRQPPCDERELSELIDAVDRGEPPPLRQAMQVLRYGPVADYFALRPAMPTYASGIQLLRRTLGPDDRVLEIGCGIGQFLYRLAACGYESVGIDIVYSKLWLAKHYVLKRFSDDIPLAAIDVVAAASCRDSAAVDCSLANRERPLTIFCHDVFYFLKEKPRLLTHWHSAALTVRLAVGHTHQRGVDPNQSGEPLAALEYDNCCRENGWRGVRLFDDHQLYLREIRGSPKDGGPTDGGPTDGGPTDGGPTDGRPTDGRPTDEGPTDEGPTDEGPTDGGPADGGPTDGRTTDGQVTDGEFGAVPLEQAAALAFVAVNGEGQETTLPGLPAPSRRVSLDLPDETIIRLHAGLQPIGIGHARRWRFEFPDKRFAQEYFNAVHFALSAGDFAVFDAVADEPDRPLGYWRIKRPETRDRIDALVACGLVIPSDLFISQRATE